MPRFMLDTDTCSYIMKRAHDAAALAAFLPYVEAVDLDEGAWTLPARRSR